MATRKSRVTPKSRFLSASFLVGWFLLCVLFALAFGLLLLDARKTPSQVIHPVSGDELKMWVFSIGQGDAILLEMPDGKQVLIDGGPNADVVSKLGSVLPPWDRSIDAMFVSHPHADHYVGFLGVLDAYDVGAVYTSGAISSDATYQAFDLRAESEGGVYTSVSSEDTFMFGEVRIEILAPESPFTETSSPNDLNDASLVMKVTYGETTILLTGDAGVEIEQAIEDEVGKIDVLKVGHHGSATSSDAGFLATIRPDVAIISAGSGNSYGLPQPGVVARYEEAQIPLFRTDIQGDILMISRGGEPEVYPAPLPF